MENKTKEPQKKDIVEDLQKKKKIVKLEQKQQKEESIFDDMLDEIQDDNLYHLMKKLK